VLTTIALITAAASIANAHNSAKLAAATLGDPYVTDAHHLCPAAKGFLVVLTLGTAGAVYWVTRPAPQA
jgi:hypothetical protein